MFENTYILTRRDIFRNLLIIKVNDAYIISEKLDKNNTVEPKITTQDPTPITNLEAVVTCMGRKDVNKRINSIMQKGVKYFTFLESDLNNRNANSNNRTRPITVVSDL